MKLANKDETVIEAAYDHSYELRKHKEFEDVNSEFISMVFKSGVDWERQRSSKKKCGWIFNRHNWTDWKTINNRTYNLDGWLIVQEKECVKCGMKKLRRSKLS